MFKDHEENLKYYVYSGIAGVIARDIWSFFSKQIGLAKFYIWQVGSSLLTPVPQITTFWGNVVGFLTDFVVASLFGMVFGFFLEWRGKRQYILKGLGAGLAVWFFFYGLLYHNLPFTKAFAPKDPMSNISAFIGHSIFGLTMALVLVNYFSNKVAGENQEKESKAKSDKKKKSKARDEEYSDEVATVPEPQIILVEVEKEKPSVFRRVKKIVKPKKL